MLDKGELLFSLSQIFQQRDCGNLGKAQSQLLPSARLACPALNGQSCAEENCHSLAGLVQKNTVFTKKEDKELVRANP